MVTAEVIALGLELVSELNASVDMVSLPGLQACIGARLKLSAWRGSVLINGACDGASHLTIQCRASGRRVVSAAHAAKLFI